MFSETKRRWSEMMRVLILLLAAAAAVVLCPLSLTAQEEVGVLKARRAILEAEREASLKKMSELRMKYIRTDRTLKRLHDRIMELHRNLAMALDAKPDVREMNEKILKLESEMESLDGKLNAGKTVPAEARNAKPGKETKHVGHTH